MNELRTLKKIGKDDFELRTEVKSAKLVTTKGYKRTELRDIYKELKLRNDQTAMQKHKLELDIKKLDVDEDESLRELAERINRAQKLLEKDKLEEQMGHVKAELNLLSKQMKEISTAVPEVLRDK